MKTKKTEERAAREQDVMGFLLERAQEVGAADEQRRNRAVSTYAARERLHRDELEDVLESVFRGKIVPPKYALQDHTEPKNRSVNVMLSDLHFGAALNPRECPKAYGFAEEARSLAAVCKQAVEYKTDHRKESKLYLHVIGDIIQGTIHDLRSGRPLTEQKGIALHLLVQAIEFLSAHWPEIHVFCTPGNHGRNPQRHKERAVNEKWDSHETDIYVGLKIAFRHFPSVKVHIDYKPYYTWQAFNKRGFATHGDTVIDVGFPSRAIDVMKIRQQVNEFNASPDNEHCDLFIFGHVHTLGLVMLPTGPFVMTNGPMIPPDEYAISKGMFGARSCSQWMFESVKDYIVGDVRPITIDDHIRNDKSLEKLISPYSGL